MKKISFKVVLFSFFATIILFSTSCVMDSVYGFDKEEFRTRIREGEWDFLKNVDYKEHSIRDIGRLGDGASYYLSFVYLNIDKRLISNKLLYQEFQKGHPYWGVKATQQLLKNLLQESRWNEVENIALDFFDDYGEDPAIQKQYIEALYRQKKDSSVLNLIETLDKTQYSTYLKYEIDLMKAVSMARLKKKGWDTEFKKIFMEQSFTAIQRRAYSFLDVYPDYAAAYSPEELSYFKAVSLAAEGQYRQSEKIVRELLPHHFWLFDTRQSVKNISKIIKSSMVITINVPGFQACIDNVEEERQHDGMVSLASMHHKVFRYNNVIDILEPVLLDIRDDTVRNDALWLYLLSLTHVDQHKAVVQLEKLTPYISDEGYLNGILNRVVTTLVKNRSWKELLRVSDTIIKYGGTYEKSRISWIKSRLYTYGYAEPQEPSESVWNNLEYIVTQDNYTSYSFMANALLGRDTHITVPEAEYPGELTPDDLWIQRFSDYGLYDEAVTYSKRVKNLNQKVVFNLSKNLADRGHHLKAIRLLRQEKIPLNKDNFSIYYPLPYEDIITGVAGGNQLSESLFSGLLRTESGFDMYVVSNAGAIGISQLIPATANEQAKKIGIPNPDLNDVGTNAAIGGSYLKMLYDRFETFPLAAMAYNAGMGNIRKWQRDWGRELPDELFMESVPFDETRTYVPKIYVSATYYGKVFFNESPLAVLQSLYPHIEEM